MQKDPKGYLITAACNPTALTLTINGDMYTLDSSTGPWQITSKGLVPDARAGRRPHRRLLSASPRPTAAILITGSELLLGLVADRNTSFLARTLDRLGVDLQRVLLVGDGEDEIVEGLRTLAGHDLLVTSGGLGPTHDDRTVAAVAAASGRSIVLDPVLRGKIAEIMDAFARRRGIPPGDYADGIDKQALVPDGAHVIDPIGTAPGLIVPWDATTVVVLPGPPAELAQMWPIVEAHPEMAVLRGGERLERSLLRVFGVSESVVARAFEDAGGDASGTTTTICARRSEVEILVRAPASARDARLRLADGMRDRLAADRLLRGRAPARGARARRGARPRRDDRDRGVVHGGARGGTPDRGRRQLRRGARRHRGLRERRQARAPRRTGSPARAPRRGLGRVRRGDGARRACGDRAPPSRISTTGIAGPGGGSEEKPVGLVYLHCATPFGERRAARGVPRRSRRDPRLGVDGGAAHGAVAVAVSGGRRQASALERV